MHRILLLTSLALAITCSYAQTPHITGTISISLRKQQLDCDLTYSQLPAQYNLRLNKAYRPRVTGGQGSPLPLSKVDSISTWESKAYALPSPLPNTLRVQYGRVLPLMNRVRSLFTDWKGNLAFTKQSFRATEQTEWYPVIYDATTNITHKAFTYDVEIRCEDCQTLFINGSAPQAGPVAHFTRDSPVPLLLFVGNYDYSQSGDVFFLNSPLTTEQEEKLSQEMAEVGHFFENLLGIPYGSELTMIQTVATKPSKRWKFNTYPSIVSIGKAPYTLASMFENKVGSRGVNSGSLEVLYHEAGHYYFGAIFRPQGSLFWAFLEGFNEYLALLAARDLLADDEFYSKLLPYYQRSTADQEFVPLAQIIERSQIDNAYRYNLIPLILSAIETRVGLPQMQAWLRMVIQTPKGTVTDYAFLLHSMQAAGFSEEDMAFFKEQYFESADCRTNCLEALGLEE